MPSFTITSPPSLTSQLLSPAWRVWTCLRQSIGVEVRLPRWRQKWRTQRTGCWHGPHWCRAEQTDRGSWQRTTATQESETGDLQNERSWEGEGVIHTCIHVQCVLHSANKRYRLYPHHNFAPLKMSTLVTRPHSTWNRPLHRCMRVCTCHCCNNITHSFPLLFPLHYMYIQYMELTYAPTPVAELMTTVSIVENIWWVCMTVFTHLSKESLTSEEWERGVYREQEK